MRAHNVMDAPGTPFAYKDQTDTALVATSREVECYVRIRPVAALPDRHKACTHSARILALAERIKIEDAHFTGRRCATLVADQCCSRPIKNALGRADRAKAGLAIAVVEAVYRCSRVRGGQRSAANRKCACGCQDCDA